MSACLDRRQAYEWDIETPRNRPQSLANSAGAAAGSITQAWEALPEEERAFAASYLDALFPGKVSAEWQVSKAKSTLGKVVQTVLPDLEVLIPGLGGIAYEYGTKRGITFDPRAMTLTVYQKDYQKAGVTPPGTALGAGVNGAEVSGKATLSVEVGRTQSVSVDPAAGSLWDIITFDVTGADADYYVKPAAGAEATVGLNERLDVKVKTELAGEAKASPDELVTALANGANPVDVIDAKGNKRQNTVEVGTFAIKTTPSPLAEEAWSYFGPMREVELPNGWTMPVPNIGPQGLIAGAVDYAVDTWQGNTQAARMIQATQDYITAKTQP